MARKRKAPAKKNSEATLEYKDGFWWIVDGKTETNVGRSRRYAEKMLAEHQ